MPWFRPPQTIGDPIPPQTLSIRRGDRLPACALVVQSADGTPIDLTDSMCYMTLTPTRANSQLGLPPYLSRLQMTIDDAVNGLVSWDWQMTNLLYSPSSPYDLKIDIEYYDGRSLTVPSGDQVATVLLRPEASSDYFYLDSTGNYIFADAFAELFRDTYDDPDRFEPA